MHVAGLRITYRLNKIRNQLCSGGVISEKVSLDTQLVSRVSKIPGRIPETILKILFCVIVGSIPEV